MQDPIVIGILIFGFAITTVLCHASELFEIFDPTKKLKPQPIRIEKKSTPKHRHNS